MSQTLSRRNFIGGAVAGMAALGLAGCAAQPSISQAESKSDADAVSANNDWLGTPPDITDEECVENLSVDVLVVGYGEAGTVAALAAADEGAKVLVIEKHFCTRYGGNGHAYINCEAFRKLGMPEIDPQEVLWDFARETQFSADLGLASLWAYQGHEVMEYLVDLTKDDGIAFHALQPYEGYEKSSQITGIYFASVGIGTKGDNNKEWLEALQRHATEKGVEVRYETPAERLIQDESGRVVGCYARNANSEVIRIDAAKGVIMCAGDYGANEAMVRTFQSTAAQKLFDSYGGVNAYTAYMEAEEQPSVALNDGLGIKMCCWAGADMECGTHGYNSWTTGGLSCKPYLYVNQGGNRFMNEAVSNLISAPLATAQPGETPFYWQVFDAASIENPLDSYMPFPMPAAAEVDLASLPSGDTIEELADAMGVPAENLKRTVDRYNELCKAGVDEDYAKDARFLAALETPPFYAAQQHHVWTVTFGGVITNRDLQVLDKQGVPIPGLYAAGNTVGRRFGWHYESSFMGCSNAFAETHGYFAAKNCVRDR